MKKLFLFIFAILLILCNAACRNTSNTTPQIEYAYDLGLSKNELSSNIGSENEDMLTALIKRGNALVLLEVVDVKPFISGDQVLCRVEKDYWGNLNYYGTEEGYIYVYSHSNEFEVGDMPYLILYGSDSQLYPHIRYGQRDSDFNVMYNADGSISVDELTRISYNITEDTDIDSIFSSSVNIVDIPKIHTLERPDSFDAAYKLSDNMLSIQVVDTRGKCDYFYAITFVALSDDLHGEYSKGEVYIKNVTLPNECEINGEYVLFLQDNHSLGNYALMPLEAFENTTHHK